MMNRSKGLINRVMISSQHKFVQMESNQTKQQRPQSQAEVETRAMQLYKNVDESSPVGMDEVHRPYVNPSSRQEAMKNTQNESQSESKVKREISEKIIKGQKKQYRVEKKKKKSERMQPRIQSPYFHIEEDNVAVKEKEEDRDIVITETFINNDDIDAHLRLTFMNEKDIID